MIPALKGLRSQQRELLLEYQQRQICQTLLRNQWSCKIGLHYLSCVQITFVSNNDVFVTIQQLVYIPTDRNFSLDDYISNYICKIHII